MITRFLRNPQLSDADLHESNTVGVRRKIIEGNSFLRSIYQEWYTEIGTNLPRSGGPVVELGSGAGFLAEYIPGLVTTDIRWEENYRAAVDGEVLPFRDTSLRAIVFVNVFHHFARPRAFLDEARRCLKPGGAIVCVEPWVSLWSRPIYRFLHHEPFDPLSPQWESKPNGPLAGGNNALPWIVFGRDQDVFRREYPELTIAAIRPMMPIRYLLSGGLAFRPLVPSSGYRIVHAIEKAFFRSFPNSAMFASITVKRK